MSNAYSRGVDRALGDVIVLRLCVVVAEILAEDVFAVIMSVSSAIAGVRKANMFGRHSISILMMDQKISIGGEVE